MENKPRIEGSPVPGRLLGSPAGRGAPGGRGTPLADRLKPAELRKAALGAGLLLELCFLSLYGVPEEGPTAVAAFMAVHLTAFFLLAFLVLRYRRSAAAAPDDRQLTWMILGFGLLFRLSLIPHAPVASDDLYRYLWDGKVLAHGINPYAYAPEDPRLAGLASELLPGRVNHPSLGSVYPPLAQAFFWVSYRLFGESVAGIKLLLVLADLATMLLLSAVLRLLGQPAVRVALYAWCPLPILYGALDGHIDLLGLPFLVLALLWGLRRRAAAAALATAAAALVKLYPLAIAPFLLRVEKGRRGVAALLLAGAVAAAAYLPFAGHMQEALTWLNQFAGRWEFNGGLFWLAYQVLGSNEAAHTAMNVLLGLWLLRLALRSLDWKESLFQVFLGLVLFGPVVHPWYLLWLAALLVVRWSPAVFVLLGLSVLSNLVVWRYLGTGVWKDDPLLLAVQYVPFFSLLLLETLRELRTTRTEEKPG